jgi:hypothetical protein
MITFIFYPTLSLSQFNLLVCEEYEGGTIRLLKADLSIDCDEDEDYQLFRSLNIVFIVVTQTTPLLYLGLLYRVRHLLHPQSKRSPQAQLRDRQKREEAEPELRPITFLFKHYSLDLWYFETVESYRRVAFISLLALMPNKILAGFCGIFMAMASAFLYDRAQPFHVSSTNSLAMVSGYQLSASYASGLFLHVGVATGAGYGDDTAFGVVVILINLAIIPAGVVMVRADVKTRAAKAEERRKLYDKLKKAEVEDRKKYDLAWQGYVNNDPGVEATLLGSLLRLKARVEDAAAAEGITIVAHPVSAGRDLDELMHAHEAANDGMHEKVRALCMAMGALEYKQGPLKKRERVEEKTATDYGGDFRQVIGKSS